MGNFLALTSVIGKTRSEVVTSLTNYANSVSGGLQQDNNLEFDTYNCCIIDEQNGNVSILYPNGYVEWDESSAFISKELNATAFSFHIHDGDFWMYVLYNNGQVVDQFNPVPDYWDDSISNEEIKNWKGNADIIVQYTKSINKSEIDKYLVRWDLGNEDLEKAYPTDEFEQEEWQLTDFMNKLNLPFPLDDNSNAKGLTFKFWTKQLKEMKSNNVKTETKSVKPWWKFW